MSYTEIKDRLRQASAQAAMKSNVIPFRPDPSPCPGDTFALRELAGVPVEVVIVERDPTDVRRLNVVLLDDYPQIGSTDVEILGELDPDRVANIRCDLSRWLDVSRLDVASRTGMLGPESLAEIHRKRDALASGRVRASLHDEEVDGDLDYRRWKDQTLHGVLASLDRPEVRPRESSRSWTRQLSIAATAAVLVFGAFWSVRQMEMLREQIEARSDEVFRLETSRSELTQQLEAANRSLTEVTTALTERERQVSEGEDRVTGLVRRVEALEADAMEPNLPFKLLNFVGSRDSGTRRGEHRIVFPEDASRVALVFEVVDPEPYSHYGLRITEQKTGEEIWRHDALQRDGSLVSLGLPASLLPSGDYLIVLSGFEKQTATPLAESYLLHVRRPGER